MGMTVRVDLFGLSCPTGSFDYGKCIRFHVNRNAMLPPFLFSQPLVVFNAVFLSDIAGA